MFKIKIEKQEYSIDMLSSDVIKGGLRFVRFDSNYGFLFKIYGFFCHGNKILQENIGEIRFNDNNEIISWDIMSKYKKDIEIVK